MLKVRFCSSGTALVRFYPLVTDSLQTAELPLLSWDLKSLFNADRFPLVAYPCFTFGALCHVQRSSVGRILSCANYRNRDLEIAKGIRHQ